MKKVTVKSYKKDKYYPRVVRAIAKILARSDIFSPIDVLLEMGNLNKRNYDEWISGKAPYLERVIEGNLSKINRILRIIAFHAHDLNMVPRQSVYRQIGKKTILRFSKSGDRNIEAAYSRQYKWSQTQEKKKQMIERSD